MISVIGVVVVRGCSGGGDDFGGDGSNGNGDSCSVVVNVVMNVPVMKMVIAVQWW